jgi:hypothetical protein
VRLRALLGVMAGLVLAITPLAASPAAAQSANRHWGQSPYFPECLEGPCRVVIVADKTFHGGYQAQIKRWVAWMNYVRVNYNLNFPAFGYFGPDEGIQPDGGCATVDGVISVCRNDSVVNADCPPPNPDVLRCGSFTIELGVQHILQARQTFRTRALDAADTWTTVCGALGSSIGMPPSSDPNSCMYSGSLTLGSGQEKYYVLDDWLYLFNAYNHSAID